MNTHAAALRAEHETLLAEGHTERATRVLAAASAYEHALERLNQTRRDLEAAEAKLARGGSFW